MKRKVARLRLSPNEEARLIREEYERRRKLRIQQVREQQRDIALHIRREVEQRRQHELERLGKELREDWECQQREKLNTLQKLYQESLQLIGQGHRSAKENEPDLAARAQKEEENHTKAEERYREALKELKSQRLKELERHSQLINARSKALQAEKERSAKVASLPPPLQNPIQNIDFKKPHIVKKSDVSAFAATHYHMSESTVDREVDAKQPNAHEGAELEVRRLQDLQREEKRRREEQLEKARLRGKLALKREHLEQDRERLLVELEHMQQTDLLRRRQQVSKMPPQIFQPLYKRQQMTEDSQREMEFAFEDMYTGERRVKGDLVVQLVPEPLPALSTGGQDQDLEVTLDEIATPVTENVQHGTEQEAGSSRQEISAQVDSSKPAPRRALKKLLDRIRSQRNVWTEHNSHVPVADSPTAITDQIPERDTTIDTGSLTSEEKDKQSATEPPEPSHSPPALETTEQSTAADILLPDAPTDRIQEFTEEQKKREKVLKKEMQQQVALLQELEEQRARLEQILLEAQQERENLKAAVTQEVPPNQPEEPAHDQEVTSVTAGPATELVPPPGEDDNTRKIREYQQQLLEQNRIHQRSVEVARQRLEEYQRALQTRYSMTTTTMLPGVVPPRLIHTSLHSARSVHPPTALPLPTTPAVPPCIPAKLKTSVEMPTREFDMLSSPLHHPGSTMLRHEVDSISNSPRDQRSDESSWLTDSIIERVTKHLPERVRPFSVTREPLHTKHQSTSIPLQPTSDPIHAISTNITDGTPLVPGHAAVKGGALPHGSVGTGSLSSREDDMEMQRQELQQAQRRMLEQREAVVLQQRRQEEERKRWEVEMEQMRQQKETLQALIHTDAQISEETITALEHLPERVRSVSVSVTREPLHNKLFPTHQSTSIPLQPTSDPIQAISPTITDGTPLVPGHAAVKGVTLPHGSVLTGSLSSREDNMERQRQRRELQQREAVVLQQKQQEEERKRLEIEMEQMRRQKETLQALIHTDEQPVPEAANEVLLSENIGQTRLKLLASLLRAIEETNGGTLSHLEDPQEKDVFPQQPPSNNDETDQDPISHNNVPAGPSPASVLPSGFLPPPRAAKPPVTRIRLGIPEMLTEQHELSAIQEVETPVNTSQVTEDNVKAPSHTVDWDPQEESRSTVDSDGTLQTPSLSSSGRRTAQSLTDSRTSPERSSHSIWRERLLMGEGTSPQSSESELFSDSRLISPLSSDSGRGADYSGPAVTSYRSPTESAHRPPDFDCLSSTTISTGSYITTDPEQNLNTDKSPSLRRCVEEGQDDLLDVSSPSVQSISVKDSSAAGSPGQAIDTVFNDSSIQRIIDRYTKELNISLGSTGKPIDSGDSYKEEPGPSVSQQSVRVSERREEEEEEEEEEDENSTVCQSPPSDTSGTQRSGLEWVGTVNPALGNFSGEDPSLAVGQEQDSFRPLIGQLTDQSSCLTADHRDASMEQLVGQPSAHSSMIGQLPGQPVSGSLDQGGWDSTLNRMILRLSRQSSSQWLSAGQDFYAGQVASEQSTTWLEGGQEESRMRPLVGELDESAGQHSGSSGERTHVDLGVSTETNVPSYLEASSHSASVLRANPHLQDQTLRNQTSLMDLGTEGTEGSESFHPLLAEVTHNETAEPSMTFHLPANDVPNSPEGQSSWDHSLPTPSEEFQPHNDPSESEQSPEHLRTEEPSTYGTVSSALHESFSQLITSQYHPCESLLVVSPTLRTVVDLTALSLSNLTMCDDTPDVSMPQPEDAFSDVCAGDLKSEQGSNLRSVTPVSDEVLVQEAASEKGILEQSEITLVSLTDTTLQDKDTTITDEEEIWEDNHSDEMMDEREKEQMTEGTESTLLQDKTPDDKNRSLPVMLLEFQWGPGEDLQEVYQQKRRALLQRSSHRVEEIKAKRALDKHLLEVQESSEAREQSTAKDSQPPVTCNAEPKSEPHHETNTKSKRGQAEQHQTTVKSGLMKKQQPRPLPPVSDSRLKVDEMKICTTEERKLNVSEMHQRTRRLYEQLEEVKHQKAIRSRQEACAKNRLRAKEFHKKTLQKLRVKQTLQ